MKNLFFICSKFQNKIYKTNLQPISVFIFLIICSYCLGNLFALIIKQVNFPNEIIFIFFICLEFISFLKYSPNIVKQKKLFLKSLNLCKSGILLGLFAEAFKVGS